MSQSLCSTITNLGDCFYPVCCWRMLLWVVSCAFRNMFQTCLKETFKMIWTHFFMIFFVKKYCQKIVKKCHSDSSTQTLSLIVETRSEKFSRLHRTHTPKLSEVSSVVSNFTSDIKISAVPLIFSMLY